MWVRIGKSRPYAKTNWKGTTPLHGPMQRKTEPVTGVIIPKETGVINAKRIC